MGVALPPIAASLDRRAMVALVVRAHKLVGQHLGPDLFVTPAWDMLLDLYASDHRRPISLTSLCGASNVPERSALRTIDGLVKRKLLVRVPDTHDHRRTNIRLSGRAVRMLNGYFDELSSHRGN